MRGLLKKLKVQADDVDTHRAKGQRKAEKSHLLEIVGKYGMSQEDITGAWAWLVVVAMCVVASCSHRSLLPGSLGTASSHRVEARGPLNACRA